MAPIDGEMLGHAVTKRADEYHPGPELTVDAALLAYRERAIATDALVRVTSLATPCRSGADTERWVLLHLINETARHAGHADATRELLDGTTGE